MRVALVYDRVNKWGGAERVLLTLHKMFPSAPLYTSVYDSDKAPWGKIFPNVIPSFLQKIPILKSHHELLGWLTPVAYELLNFDDYDLVISVTSEAAKGIITKPGTRHICICLTPTRYLWSGYEEYLEDPSRKLNWIPFYKFVSKPFLGYAKMWDRVASQRPDVMIAISTEVKNRIKKFYKRDSQVIHPPVDIAKFRVKDSGQKNYYLIVSRLVPYKKVGLVIKAFNELKLPLVIVGVGSEERKLRKMARNNINFVGFVSEKELVTYYQGAKALIMAQEEDFGIVSIEAQAAGVPVISYKKGGALDTIIEGKTGVFFDKQTSEDLMVAVRQFNNIKYWDKNVCVRNAEKFSEHIFKKQFLKLVEKVIGSQLQ